MSKLSLILAVVAIGLGGYAASEMCCRDQRLSEMEDGVRDVRTSMADLDAKLDRLLASGGHVEPAMLSAEGGGSPAVGRGAGLATRTPATPGERLAALEETVAEQRETIADLKEKADKAPAAPSPMRFMGRNSFYRNLDAAAKSMELSERQKVDMQDAIDLGKRELADLYAIENDDGETWADLRKGRMTQIGTEGGITVSMPDFRKIAKFKKARVPGTAETFGDAEKRIRKDAFADMRRTLTPAQSKKWDSAHKDPLLGSSMGGSGVMISAFTTDLSDDDK